MNEILFHSLKHHKTVGLAWLKHKSEPKELVSLGNSQFDYYIGNLSVQKILNEVSNSLLELELLSRDKFKAWVESNNRYREINISDSSKWTLRYLEEEKYIHLHPSRYSKHTLRINATTLKTVMCTLQYTQENKLEVDIETINHCRTAYLDMSPLNNRAKHKHLEKIFALFREERINE